MMIDGGTAVCFNAVHTAFRGMGTPLPVYPAGADRFALLFVFIGVTLSALVRKCCGLHSNHQCLRQ